MMRSRWRHNIFLGATWSSIVYKAMRFLMAALAHERKWAWVNWCGSSKTRERGRRRNAQAREETGRGRNMEESALLTATCFFRGDFWVLLERL
jgi:hypothetical protein